MKDITLQLAKTFQMSAYLFALQQFVMTILIFHTAFNSERTSNI